ncbi:MAG: High affinity cAMP-specific 3',5'-cyclic phosphodiesterase 7A [Marteilia pararefringens]
MQDNNEDLCRGIIDQVLQKREKIGERCSIELIMGLDFDPMIKTLDELVSYSFIILKYNNLISANGLREDSVLRFLISIKDNYHSTPDYHNFIHGFLVFQFANYFLLQSGLIKLLSPRWVFVFLITALGHDLGHPGIGNMTIKSLRNPQYHRCYSNSLLEDYHSEQLIHLLFCNKKTALLNHLPRQEQFNIQSDIRKLIIATDIFHHQAEINSYDSYIKDNIVGSNENGIMSSSARNELINSDEGLLVLSKMIMKISDTSNEFRGFQIFKKIYINLIYEFKQQYRFEEIAHQMHSLDLSKISLVQFETSFIENCIHPVFDRVANVFPQINYMRDLLMNNMSNFQNQFNGIEADHPIFNTRPDNIKAVFPKILKLCEAILYKDFDDSTEE